MMQRRRRSTDGSCRPAGVLLVMSFLLALQLLSSCAKNPQKGGVDTFVAPNGRRIVITCIKHASLEINYRGKEFEIDPVFSAVRPIVDYTDKPQADYVLVHFILEREPLTDGDIYVNGSVTNDNFLPEYKMVYDNESKAYEATLLLKQGYYNYQYLFLPDKGNEGGLTETVEGNYFETENKYTILVYYKPQGGRYDQLVGVREFRYFPNR